MNEQAISSPSQVTIYNPNEIINLFSDSLSRRGPGIVNVRGICESQRGKASVFRRGMKAPTFAFIIQ